MRIRQCLGWVVILLAWTHVASAEETAACDPWAARITSVQGKVEARRSKSPDWQIVKLHQTFCAGDRIRVGDRSRAGIILANETLVRLDQNTAINLTAVEKESLSLIEILKGIAHFISRVPRSLKVTTPFVNAAIEGTEFVVEVGNTQSAVTVFEGTVLTQNDQGELRISNNETAVANQGAAPQKTLLARPRDTVQWALYFPPIIKAEKGKLSDASQLLYFGRVAEARELLQGLDSGEAKSLLAIIDIVNNDEESGFKLASEAIQQAPQSAATHIAMSYAWQAKLDLAQALGSARQATTHEPGNAIAWARLAELQLSTGELDQALASAQQATQLDANLSRTQSILGYAYLVRIDIDNALSTFNRAIELDQADPLPRLGLGLAKIRKNRLEEGRRNIEIAALLDPNNAIIRSYLGKAYYEEKRAPLDATQFDMAKSLDPNDPTPYYYDAIRKQTENRPVEALADLNKSIELNDNRAVYRSSLQLDQDEAARNASASRIYQELGYEQLAINHASKSLSQDPKNYSAHELLADSYLSKPRHEIARVSESLQAKLLNPLNSNPQQPQISQGSLTLLNNLGPTTSASYEYNKLFQRDSINLVLNGLDAANKTNGREAVISGIYDGLAFSFGKYHYETDGFHANNRQDQELKNYFLQAKVTDNFSFFLEKNNKIEILGDDYRFDPTNFFTTVTRTDDVTGERVGMRYTINPNNTIIGTYLRHERDADRIQSLGFFGNLIATTDDKGGVHEFRYIHSNNYWSLTAGISDSHIDNYLITTLNGFPVIPASNNKIDDSSMYVYSYFQPVESLNLTAGVSRETYKFTTVDIEETNPKIGLTWSLHNNFNIRIAYFEAVRKYTAGDSTVEPTMVSGFNQFYDDEPGTESQTSAAAVDYKLSDDLSLGLEYIYRELDVPRTSGANLPMSEKTTSLFAYWTVNRYFALNAKLQKEDYTRGTFPGNSSYEYVTTYKAPIGFDLFLGNRFKANLLFTYIEQEGSFINVLSSTAVPGEDKFWHTDLSLIYQLPRRYGTISLGVKNLFEEEFKYEETDKKKPTLAPVRTGFASINLVF